MDLFEEIVRLRRAGIGAALATVVGSKGSTPAKPPARMIVRTDGETIGTVGGGCVEADVIRAARDAMDTGRVRLLSFRLAGEEAERTGIACGGIVEVMVEPLEDQRVVIVGAGHLGQAVSGLAARVGLAVTVVDDRPDFANENRFPDAREVVVADLDALDGRLTVGRQTSILVMTRGHAEDMKVLRWALGTEAGHIGVLGSRSKRKRFLDEAVALGFPRPRVESISMPVGLDLGAETVEEIAVSIVAELIARRRGAPLPHA